MSTQRRIYLDFNATGPLAPAARAAMAEAMEEVGNPSSVHAEGRRARDRVERARDRVAALVSRGRDQIVFTSGGTEANALGLLALAATVEKRGKDRTLCLAPIDHPSLVGAAFALRGRGWTVHWMEVSRDGVVGAPAASCSLVALSLANHELGTMPEIAPLLLWAQANDALVHVDAVQAVGKRDLSVLAGVHAIAISGHKIGGPQGVGALALSLHDGLPIIEAGHQERGLRPGTENTLGIIGLGAAVSALDLDDWRRVAVLGQRLEDGLRSIDGVRIHGASAPRIGGTINAGFSGALGESIVIGLDLEGVAVSTGAACTSGSVQPSAVLLALGSSPIEAREAVRFSLGRATTEADVDAVLAMLPAIVKRVRVHGA